MPFATPNDCTSLKNRTSLLHYVLNVSCHKIEGLRSEPEYKQLAHSKRILKYLTDITKILYEGCVQRLSMYCNEYDVGTAQMAVECFQKCLQIAKHIYHAKFIDVFLKDFDIQSNSRSKEGCVRVLQTFIDAFMKEQENSSKKVSTRKSKDTTKANLMNVERITIVQNLFDCLDILYDYHPFDHPITTESYSWLLQYCQSYPVENTSLLIVHKLLFKQRRKTHSGAFFQIVPLHLAKIWSFINDDIENEVSMFETLI